MAKIYKTDGTVEETSDLSLENMQKAVGGYIEIYRHFVVNEEGLLIGLPTNPFYRQFVGNVIVLSSKELRGL